MQRPNFSHRLFVVSSLFLATACSSGGGGGGATVTPPQQIAGPQFPAAVPAGTGTIEIDMTGTWTVTAAEIVETNNTTQQPPADGTPFQLGGDRLTAIAGLEVSAASLSVFLGFPLLYINEADGKTLFYAVTYDLRGVGGALETSALAGGSVDDNTIAFESFVSSQLQSEPEPRVTRSRYLLRRAATAPVTLDAARLDAEDPLADDERAVLRARLRAALGLAD